MDFIILSGRVEGTLAASLQVLVRSRWIVHFDFSIALKTLPSSVLHADLTAKQNSCLVKCKEMDLVISRGRFESLEEEEHLIFAKLWSFPPLPSMMSTFSSGSFNPAMDFGSSFSF